MKYMLSFILSFHWN